MSATPAFDFYGGSSSNSEPQDGKMVEMIESLINKTNVHLSHIILAFFRLKKTGYDEKKLLKLLKELYDFATHDKKKNGLDLNNWTIDQVCDSLKRNVGIMCLPLAKDIKGRPVVFYRANKFQDGKSDLHDVMVSFFVIFCVLSKRLEVRRDGISLLVDMKGWNQKENFSMAALTSVNKWLTQYSPVEFASILMVNAATVFDVVITLLSPVMPADVREKIENVEGSKVVKSVPAEFVPTEFSGTANWSNDEFVNTYKSDIEELLKELKNYK